ncbi:MAG TPA: hypothetical protein VK859_01165 [bacterium]|jgi:hypothetical protein|nr:hypothetical protein [bacterium]
MLAPKSPGLNKALNYFWPRSGESPCIGVALGRRALWAVQTSPLPEKSDDRRQVDWSERIPLEFPLFEGEPSDQTMSQLARALAPLFDKARGTYSTFQVALPDPLVKFEVFELEKVPEAGKAMDEFLTWRFNQGKEESPVPLAFAHQLLGSEDGKSLVLGMALEQKWLQAVQRAFERALIPLSVTDMALGHRLHFFHDSLREKAGSGALLSFESEYWSLALWDKEDRPRFARSKWWKEEAGKLGDIPLAATVLEAERTIRSYVYSGKDRSVEKLYVLAPEEWLGGILKALRERTEGNGEGLSLDGGILQMPAGGFRGTAPSAIAAAVGR